MTNGDKIRAMTDEQIADYYEAANPFLCANYCPARKLCEATRKHPMSCKQVLMLWLKQEIKSEET